MHPSIPSQEVANDNSELALQTFVIKLPSYYIFYPELKLTLGMMLNISIPPLMSLRAINNSCHAFGGVSWEFKTAISDAITDVQDGKSVTDVFDKLFPLLLNDSEFATLDLAENAKDLNDYSNYFGQLSNLGKQMIENHKNDFQFVEPKTLMEKLRHLVSKLNPIPLEQCPINKPDKTLQAGFLMLSNLMKDNPLDLKHALRKSYHQLPGKLQEATSKYLMLKGTFASFLKEAGFDAVTVTLIDVGEELADHSPTTIRKYLKYAGMR